MSVVDSQRDTEAVLNIAFYRFVTLRDLAEWRTWFRELAARLGLKGTILLSEEGINAFLAGSEAEVRGFLCVISEREEFRGLPVKESWTETLPFNRMFVKLKKEIISMGRPEVRPSEKTAQRLLPAELKQWLDEGRPVTLLDTRNDYEIRLGAFKGAMSLGMTHFRQFPERLGSLISHSIPALDEAPVVMYCTGGIRCEKAGALALDLGLKDVYQLEGGILRYFEECGEGHFQGECFVFDHRVAVGPDLSPSHSTIQCFQCRMPLTPEDQASPRYCYEKSCPHCFKADRTQREETECLTPGVS